MPEQLIGIQLKTLPEVLHATCNACYDGMIKAVKSASDASQLRRAFEGLSGCTPHQIKAAVENPIHGIRLPERLNHNRRATLDRIRRDVAVSLQNGDRYTMMAKRISDDLDMDYRKSIRVARTEAHRVREQGFIDSSDDIQDKLIGSGYVMTKTWRTMQDESVRPQLTKKGKPKGTANHRVMQDVTVLQDEDFDLGNGVFAPCPGSSGDAGNDINCRCRESRKLMKVEDYEQLTGKSVPAKYRKCADAADNSENEVDNDVESGIIKNNYYYAGLKERREERRIRRQEDKSRFDPVSEEYLDALPRNRV